MIYVYPSTLPGEPLERHEHGRTTIEVWLRGNVDGYEPRDEPPISISVDGAVVPPARWVCTIVTAEQCVEIRPQPGDPGTLAIAAVVAGVVAVGAALLLKPSIPGQRNKSSRGSSIYEVNAQGNQPKLGDVIPEIAGTHKHFPDYLTAPRRYFVGPKTQALDLLLCVGKGEHDVPDDEIRIGETPVTLLGGAVDYQVFDPGQDVSGHVAHRRWYNAPEVGATTGGSGIRLLSTNDLEQTWDAVLSLSGTTITGDDQPESWVEDVILEVAFRIPVDVGTDGNNDNTFEMDIAYLTPSVGQELRMVGVSGLSLVRIASINSGVYTLERYQLVSTQPDEYGWVVIDDIGTGSYFAGVYDSPLFAIACRVTGVTGGIDVVMQRGGGDVGGWPGFPSSVSDVSVNIDEGQRVGIWSNAFLACPRGEVTSRIEWDIFAPSGLGYINDNGDVETRSRDLELQWRPAGDETWTTASEAITGRTRDQLGWTFVVDLPSAMTPEVRVRRVSAEDNSTQALDRLEWYGLRSELPGAKSSYPGVTVLAMTVTGSNAIASQTDNQVNVIASRKLPTLDGAGGWTAAQATRSIAAWLAYVATSVGYADDELDMDELQRLDTLWSSRSDWFDFVHSDDSTVRETLQRCLRAGMAELTLDAGRLAPRRDEPRTAFEHMYTPQNMLEPLSRTVQAPRPDDPDGVEVEYFSGDTWTEETVECRLPGDMGVRAEKVRLDGVTDRTRAWRIGMRRRRELKYRRWEYDFSTELDALNSRYLSYCAVADDVPGYGQSSVLEMIAEEGSEYRLVVSEPMAWTDGESHVVAWRRPDGTLAGPFPAAQGADEYQILATHGGEPAPSMDRQQELPHVLFGTTERWSYPVLVQEINPQGFERVSVTAAGYDERVYADDDNEPPA